MSLRNYFMKLNCAFLSFVELESIPSSFSWIRPCAKHVPLKTESQKLHSFQGISFFKMVSVGITVILSIETYETTNEFHHCCMILL